MKRKIAVVAALIFLFALGFWSSGRITGSAKSYEAGSKQNPLASKSYLEEAVDDQFEQLEKEVEALSERVESLRQALGK